MAVTDPAEEWRQGMAQWLTANGITPRSVPRESTFEVVDGPDGTRVMHYIEFVLTEDGRLQVDPEDKDTVWTRPATAPCKVEPAPWLKVEGARPA